MVSNAYLLDTHIFLWWAEDSERLSAEYRRLLLDSNNQFFVSVVSLWEIVIKEQIGKIKLPAGIELEQVVENAGFSLLSIEAAHVSELKVLPNLHKDPFDRMLISQSRVEELPLLTVDHLIQQYEVSIV